MIVKVLRRLISLLAPDEFFVKRAVRRGLKLGRNCRIYTRSLGGEPYLVTIGDHVTLSKDVELITHDGGIWVFREKYPDLDVVGKIVIGDNVFIGAKSILLPGTVIESNVVVGAGAVVRGRLESGWVYAGVPAKKIKSLAEYETSCLSSSVKTKHLDFEGKRSVITRIIN